MSKTVMILRDTQMDGNAVKVTTNSTVRITSAVDSPRKYLEESLRLGELGLVVDEETDVVESIYRKGDIVKLIHGAPDMTTDVIHMTPDVIHKDSPSWMYMRTYEFFEGTREKPKLVITTNANREQYGFAIDLLNEGNSGRGNCIETILRSFGFIAMTAINSIE